MADFSKQWCDLNDPEMPHDFDIEHIASKLNPDYYQSYICEGFGFTAVGKDTDGEIMLYFPSDSPEERKYFGWVKYSKFIEEQKQREL